MPDLSRYMPDSFKKNSREYKINSLLSLRYGIVAPPFNKDQWIKDRESCEAALKNKSIEELDALHKEALMKKEEARFCNNPSSNIDYNKYKKISFLESIEEATAFLLGKNPKIVNLKSLQSLPMDSDFRRKFEELNEIIKRAFYSQEFTKINKLMRKFVIDQTMLINWAIKNGITLSEELIQAYNIVSSSKSSNQTHKAIFWFRKQMRDKINHLKPKDFWHNELKDSGIRVSKRAFDRIWSAEATPEMKSPGAKKKNIDFS